MSRSFRAAALVLAGVGRLVCQQPQPVVDPGAVDQHSSDTAGYYALQDQIERQNRRGEAAPLTNLLAAPSLPSALKEEPRFFLRTVQVDSSSILSPEDLTAVLRRYENREATLGDLNSIVADINKLYQSRGFVTATALLPPQTVVNGLVRIQLIEARLGKVIVKNNRHTRSSYFTDRLPMKPGDLLQINQVQQSLTLFNQENDVAVRAMLQPGERLGATDLVLTAQPAPWQTLSCSFDDSGISSMGSDRLGVTETIGSVIGYRDPLSAGGYWSTGMWATFASYNFPLTAGGMRLGPTFSYNNITIQHSPLQKLGVNGSFYDLSLRLSRPYRIYNRFVVTAFIAPHYQVSTLRSESYSLSNVPVRSVETGVDLQAPDARGFWSGNVALSGGDYDAAGLHTFVKVSGAVTRYQNLPRGFTLLFRGQGQGKAADPQPLPPSQQFQIGGIASIRGYPEGSLIADDGYLASAELGTPLPLGVKKLFGVPLNQRFRSAWFVDHGSAFTGARALRLTGAGGGLVVNLSRMIQGRVYLGTPLEDRSQYKSLEIHFGITANPIFRRSRDAS